MREGQGAVAMLFQEAKEKVLLAIQQDTVIQRDMFAVSPDKKHYVRVLVSVGRVDG